MTTVSASSATLSRTINPYGGSTSLPGAGMRMLIARPGRLT